MVMESKLAVKERLGINKLGKKTNFKDYDAKGNQIHINVGDEVVVAVSRWNNVEGFAIARYNDAIKRYVIAYDPDAKSGRIKEITAVYAIS